MHKTAFGSKMLLLLAAYFFVACQVGSTRSNKRSGGGPGNALEAASATEPATATQATDPAMSQDDPGTEENRVPAVVSASETLTWKRYRAFEHGLASGLSLSKDELCTELGRSSCINQAHLAVLGGNEPYVQAQYERLQGPSALTPIAVERIVLAACERRRILDRELGEQAVVFKDWGVSGSAVSSQKIKALATELYRRLLARDPMEEELTSLENILQVVQAPEKVALSICFAIGSQAENVFL